jgi:hypothetical protein
VTPPAVGVQAGDARRVARCGLPVHHDVLPLPPGPAPGPGAVIVLRF